ncbi:MAG: hypothetical protein Q9218_004009 [Villophora microphyllina]
MQLYPLTNVYQSTHLPIDDIVTQSLTQHLSKSWSNPRKRPSIPSDLFDSAQNGSTLSEISNGAHHPQKRSRATEWPLTSTDESNAQPLNLRRANRVSQSPARKQSRVLRPRPSKFLEGSMNDRASKKPPSIYMGDDDDAMEPYHNQSSQDDDKVDYDAGIETIKPSGMYRFGRALVNAFNPVNVWQGINGIWKDKEGQNQPDKSLLQDRKVKAERAYAELKKNGFKGTQPFSTRAASIDSSDISRRRSQDQSSSSFIRDSGVDLDASHAPSDSKCVQPSNGGSEDLLIPRSSLEPRPVPSPQGQADGGRNSSLSLSRPSFQSLKKVKSHMQLPSARRKAADIVLSSPKIKLDLGNVNGQALRRQPSKKDIAKQKKLSKQVSDLEYRLEAARRELQLSRGQGPDVPKIPKSGRQPFKPGTLPSLPSESTMNAMQSTEQESEIGGKPPLVSKSRKETSTPRKSALKATTAKTPQATRQVGPNHNSTTPTSSGKKRKLSGGGAADRSYKPMGAISDSESDVGMVTRRMTRARKAHKVDEPLVLENVEAKSNQFLPQIPQGLHASMPRTGTSESSDVAPPASLDPAKIDTEKILAMRSVPMNHLPFGSHLDDIVNLQKALPNCNQKQIDQLLLSLSKVRQDSEQSAIIQRYVTQPSASVSPLKQSASDNKPFPTRTTRLSSSPNRAHGNELSTIEEAITVDPTRDKSIPPLPVSPVKTTQNLKNSNALRAKNIDKPLPEIQKENYSWPEDVF